MHLEESIRQNFFFGENDTAEDVTVDETEKVNMQGTQCCENYTSEHSLAS